LHETASKHPVWGSRSPSWRHTALREGKVLSSQSPSRSPFRVMCLTPAASYAQGTQQRRKERRDGPLVRPPFLEQAIPPGDAARGEGTGPRRASKEQPLAAFRTSPRQPNPEVCSLAVAHSAPHAVVDRQQSGGDTRCERAAFAVGAASWRTGSRFWMLEGGDFFGALPAASSATWGG
jgi:hypothetical protein